MRLEKPWGSQYVMPDGNVLFLDGYGNGPPSTESVIKRYEERKTRDAARNPEAVAFGLRLRKAKLARNIIMHEICKAIGINCVEYCQLEFGRRFATEAERAGLIAIFPELDTAKEAPDAVQ